MTQLQYVPRGGLRAREGGTDLFQKNSSRFAELSCHGAATQGESERSVNRERDFYMTEPNILAVALPIIFC